MRKLWSTPKYICLSGAGLPGTSSHSPPYKLQDRGLLTHLWGCWGNGRCKRKSQGCWCECRCKGTFAEVHLRPVTSSNSVLLGSGSSSAAALRTEKLTTLSFVSCCSSPNTARGATSPCICVITIKLLLLLLHADSAKRGKVSPADKLQVKAANFLPLVGLARSKQDPIKCGHGAQYLYRPPPAGAQQQYIEAV